MTVHHRACDGVTATGGVGSPAVRWRVALCEPTWIRGGSVVQSVWVKDGRSPKVTTPALDALAAARKAGAGGRRDADRNSALAHAYRSGLWSMTTMTSLRYDARVVKRPTGEC